MKASRCETESVCSFHIKGRKGKANQGSEKLSEGVYKRRKLCCSVKETQGRFDCEITCIGLRVLFLSAIEPRLEYRPFALKDRSMDMEARLWYDGFGKGMKTHVFGP